MKLTNRSTISSLLKALRVERELAAREARREAEEHGQASQAAVRKVKQIDLIGKSIQRLVEKSLAA